MGDCVRYLTKNDTVTPANSSGCNGFCFPFTYTAGGTGHNPEVVSIQQCKKWYSRVKNWSLSTDAAIVDAFGNAFSMGGGGTMTPNVLNATTELQLINPGRIRNFGFTSGSNDNADVSFVTNIIKDTGDLYPGFDGISSISGTGPGSGQMLIYMYDNGAGLPGITGNVDGISIPIFYDTTTFPITSFTLSTWSLTPVEYWPYGQHSNGAAIYDTSTGAILPGRSPLA